GAMVAFMPVYLLAIGLTESGAGWILGGLMIGVIVVQVPVAWLADRLGRTPVLLGCYAVTLVTLAALYAGLPLGGLVVCLFLAAACSSAFYPLGLSLLGEQTPPGGLARANAWFLTLNCVGSLTGPASAGAVMDFFGRQSLFAIGGLAVLAVLGAWGALRKV